MPVLPFEAFPPPIAVVVEARSGLATCRSLRRGGFHLLPDCHPALLPRLRGALKPDPAVVLQLSLPDPCLIACDAHAPQKFTSRLTASPFS